MDHIVDVLMSVWDQPVFQHISGIIVGMSLLGTVWSICSAYRHGKIVDQLLEAARKDKEGESDNDEA